MKTAELQIVWKPSGQATRTFHISPPDENNTKHQDRFLKIEPKTLIWKDTLEHAGDVVLKMYRHRGYRSRRTSCRVEREYNCLQRLASGGIPMTTPVFWTRGRHPSHGFYEILGTLEIEGSTALREYLQAMPEAMTPRDLVPLFLMMRTMHKCGVRHGAMSFKNVLVTRLSESRYAFWIIDLSRAVLFPNDIVGTRMAWFDLLDICRKVAFQWQPESCQPLLAAYGLSRNESDTMIHRVATYNPTRHTRNRLRAEFAFRSHFMGCDTEKMEQSP